VTDTVDSAGPADVPIDADAVPRPEIEPVPIHPGRAKFLHRRLDEASVALTAPWQALLGAVLEQADPSTKLAAVKAALAAVELESTPAADPFPFVDPLELAQPVPPPDYPVQDFAMAPGPPTLFLSFSFGGKSVILQDLLLSIACGQRVWGYYRCEEGLAVHFDHEQGKAQTIDRYHRLARGRGIALAELSKRLRLSVFPRGHLYMPGAEEAYKRACDGARIAFIDTLNAASPGHDENESTFSEGLLMLGRVSEATGCTIVLAHHMGKATLSGGPQQKGDPRTWARGHSSIQGAAGYVYAMGGGKGEPKLLQQTKARGLGDPTVEDFYLELGPVDVRATGYFNDKRPADPGGFRVTYRTLEQVNDGARPGSKSAKQRALIALVIEYVHKENARGRAVPGKNAIVKNVEGRDIELYAAIDTALAEGLLEDRPERRQGKAYPRYWVVADAAARRPPDPEDDAPSPER
jgi:hypothetical protein